MATQSNREEISFLEIEKKEAIKCGEIISFDDSEFWYSCSFCQKQITINNSFNNEFIKHIKEEFSKNCQAHISSTNTISSEDNPIDDAASSSIEHNATEFNLTEGTNLVEVECGNKIDCSESVNQIAENMKIENESEGEYLETDDKWNTNEFKCSKRPSIYRHATAQSSHNNKKHLESESEMDLNELNHMVVDKGKYNESDKIYKSKRSCSTHNFIRIKLKKTEIDPIGRYTCNVCDGRFEKAFQLRMHRLNTHSGDLTCEICGKIFTTKRYYDVHKQDVHTDVTYTCDKCDKIFKKRSLLKDHVMRDHLKKYQCSICLKTFLSVTQVRAHETIHGAKKAFQCDECGKSFPRFFQLGLHKKSHANLREYQCDICDKRCNTDRALRNHKQWHTESRDFVCQVCSKSFKTSGCLTKHKRIHSSSGSYKCDACGKLFSQSSYLKVHLKSHNVKPANVKS